MRPQLWANYYQTYFFWLFYPLTHFFANAGLILVICTSADRLHALMKPEKGPSINYVTIRDTHGHITPW